MKTREQKIESIYGKIANKELTTGCLFTGKHVIGDEILNYYCPEYEHYVSVDGDIYEMEGDGRFVIDKIKGHPVMIGDVLDYGDGFYQYSNHPKTKDIPHSTKWDSPEDVILELWRHKRKSIDDQPDDCINFIHSLLEQGQK